MNPIPFSQLAIGAAFYFFGPNALDFTKVSNKHARTEYHGKFYDYSVTDETLCVPLE
jgi:hypothetical protein